jgi:hypothetical protein
MHARWVRFLLSFLVAAGVAAARGNDGLLLNARKELLVASNGKPARLRNNPEARDRTLREVLHFLVDSDVNKQPYRSGQYVCTEFAVALHDEAEAAGIRAALVSLSFYEGVGHALNAFNTTDYGVVYIDSTGTAGGDPNDHYDTIGFIQIGKPYGRLHVELAARWPNDYRKYEDSKAIFRNLEAWDSELTGELAAINRATQELQDRARRPTRPNQRTLRKTAEDLQARVDKYNRMLEYRNQVVNTFRLQYSENKSPVKHIDVFW